MSTTISKTEYAQKMGFTRADKVRLAIVNNVDLLNELNLINYNKNAKVWRTPELKILEKYFGKIPTKP